MKKFMMVSMALLSLSVSAQAANSELILKQTVAIGLAKTVFTVQLEMNDNEVDTPAIYSIISSSKKLVTVERLGQPTCRVTISYKSDGGISISRPNCVE